MRQRACIGLLAVLVAGLSSLAASAAATTPKLPDMPQSYIFTPAGKLTTLRAGVTYQASLFFRFPAAAKGG